MSFFEWLEQTALAEWMRVSIAGYPTMLTLHAFGLAVLVGTSVLLSLRVLGVVRKLPAGSLDALFRVAWVGLVVNTVSGVSLWTMQAADYVHSVPFLIKISGVGVGAVLVAVLQRQTAEAGAASHETMPPRVKLVAVATLVVWAISMVAGRLIAYPELIFGFLAALAATVVVSLLAWRLARPRSLVESGPST